MIPGYWSSWGCQVQCMKTTSTLMLYSFHVYVSHEVHPTCGESNTTRPQHPTTTTLSDRPCIWETDESVTEHPGLCQSDQLPLISCPSSSPPPSISTHKKADSCIDHHLRFKNMSCHAGGWVPQSWGDNKEEQKHPFLRAPRENQRVSLAARGGCSLGYFCLSFINFYFSKWSDSLRRMLSRHIA